MVDEETLLEMIELNVGTNAITDAVHCLQLLIHEVHQWTSEGKIFRFLNPVGNERHSVF